MILKQNLDVLVPKCIGAISFDFHFLEQIQKADLGASVFGSWVDVIRNRRPDSLKRGRATLQKVFRPNASNNKRIRFREKLFLVLVHFNQTLIFNYI